MFIDTIEIKHIIINLDGLVIIEGKRHIRKPYEFNDDDDEYPDIDIERPILQALEYLIENFDCSIVSQFKDPKLKHIVNSCLELEGPPSMFPATNEMEEFRVVPQLSRAINDSVVKPCNIVYFYIFIF